MTLSELTLMLMEAGQQVRVMHWQTKSYAEHMALGILYDAIQESTDSIVEAASGVSSAPALKGCLEIYDYKKDGCIKYLEEFAKELSNIGDFGTDILNMRDDLLGIVNKTRYLLTLT